MLCPIVIHRLKYNEINMTSKPMNILQVTTAPTYPPERGGSHRNHGLVLNFISQGDTVRRITQGGPLENYIKLNTQETVEIRQNYTEIRYMNPLYDITSLPVLFDYPYAFLGATLGIWTPKNIQAHISWADAILVEGPWQVRTIEHLASDTPVVYSSHNVEIEDFAHLRGSLIGEIFYNRTYNLEGEALGVSDLVVCTSERDLMGYRDRYNFQGEGMVLPNGTYLKNIKSSPPKSELGLREKLNIPKDVPVGLFVGSKHLPNVEGMEALIDNLPSLPSKKDVHIVVGGNVCDELSERQANVHLVGFIDELEPYFSMADCCLNPMVSGGGTNVKMFDYLASGTPVISTPFGTRGIDVESDQNILIAEIEEIYEKIQWVHDNQQCANKIAYRGKRLVKEKYTWESISNKYRSRILELVESK